MTEKAIEVGTVVALYIYPVKSMRGIAVETARLWWYGLDGDRKYAFVRPENRSGFPWLTGRDLPDLLRYRPTFAQPDNPSNSEVVVKTPDGDLVSLNSFEESSLEAELSREFGGPVKLLKVNRGTFDAMPLSLISTCTLENIGQQLGQSPDPLRFRPNIVVKLTGENTLSEDHWGDQTLIFGNRSDSARIHVNHKTQRCLMINLDPDSAKSDPRFLKNVAANREGCAGIYATTKQPGLISVGDSIRLAN